MMKPTVPALALAVSLLSAGQACAHAHLRAETPAADAVVTSAPVVLSLSFSEGLEIGLSGATLKGPGGKAVATGTATLAPGDDKQMSVPLNGALAAGTYTVEWHALSKDGHTTHGTYHFTVSP